MNINQILQIESMNRKARSERRRFLLSLITIGLLGYIAYKLT